MSKNFWLLLIASFIVFPLYSQSAVGIKFDINGMPLHGYHNPLTYLSKKSISKMNNDETFENGFYIDFAGKKYEGLIKFQHQKIVFKPNENASKIKIKPSEIQSFVVGQDSCLTISNYYNNKTNVAEHSFLQFVTKLDNGLAFAIKHKPKSKSYFIKRPKNDLWEIVNKKFFKKHALQYFGHIPYLKNKIEAKEYTHENLEPIIKMMEYHEKFLNKKPIYYNQYWQETTKPKNAKFKAFITDRSNDRWTLSYFQNDTLLYKANYTSFFPHKKEGEFIAYYANGKTRQTNFYKDIN
jgi:hypothetical protein